MSFAIRPYHASDYDWVLQCEIELQEHERAVHDPRLPNSRLPGRPHSQDYLAMLWPLLRDNQGVMLIGEIGGLRQGLIAGYIVDEPWPMETQDSWRHGYVSDIFVAPAARGAGLAQALVDALAAHLHGADPALTRLRINVLAANAIARGAYEKAGFIPYEVMYERKLGAGG